MWTPEASRLITIFWNQYLHNYAALPSNCHLAKSTVKDASFCMIIGRSKATSSMVSTARLGLAERLNITARKYLKDGKIWGNHTVTAGTYRNRKRKLDGADYEEKEYQQQLGGWVRSGTAIKIMKSRSDAIHKLTYLPEQLGKWKRIRSGIDDYRKSVWCRTCYHQGRTVQPKWDKAEALTFTAKTNWHIWYDPCSQLKTILVSLEGSRHCHGKKRTWVLWAPNWWWMKKGPLTKACGAQTRSKDI